MRITPTLTALLTRSEGSARDFLQTLSTGQRLQGKVVDVPAGGTARLQIGLIELLARSDARLTAGQSLELEVKQLKPLPELKILNPPPARTDPERVLQQALPKQLPIREVMRELQRLIDPAATRSPPESTPPNRGGDSATGQLSPAPRGGKESPGAGAPRTQPAATPRGSAVPGYDATPTPLRAPGPTPSTASTPNPLSGDPATRAGRAPSPSQAPPAKPAPASDSVRPTTTGRTQAPTFERAETPLGNQPPAGRSPGPSTALPSSPATIGSSLSPDARPAVARLPQDVLTAVRQLLGAATPLERLDGGQVQRQLHESGLFLERRLAQGVVPKADTKLDLLRLMQLLLASRDRPPPSGTESAPGRPARSGEPNPPPAGQTAPAAAQVVPAPNASATNPIAGLTEQLLRLLTGAGRRGGSGTTAHGVSTPGVEGPPQPARGDAPPEPKLKAEQLLRALQNEQDTRTGKSETLRPGEPSTAHGGPQRALVDRLLQLVEGGLARIQTHQGATLARGEDGQQIWQFELPLARGPNREEVMVRLEREAEGKTPAAPPRWTATLRFAFDSLGSIEARLLLEGERLSSTFWCERAATEQRFAGRLPELEKGLRKVGLEIGRLSAVQGTPPDPLDLPKPPAGLLDTRV